MEGWQAVALPALTLGGVFIAPVARMTRTAVLDVLGAEHVRTARAKGLTERAVVLHHALRNALIPVVTLIGLQIGFLLGGAVVTETVFSWPGVGRLAVGAILSSDFPMAQGTIIVLSLGFILINLVVDLLYVMLDPRMRGPEHGQRYHGPGRRYAACAHPAPRTGHPAPPGAGARGGGGAAARHPAGSGGRAGPGAGAY
ncbi:ABC transporter permease [Pseudoroseomonas wenyumeiae]